MQSDLFRLLPHKDDLVLGRLVNFALAPTFRLRQTDRTTHCYVLGITGQGKSKLLEQMLYQDITAGRGCGLIDPHTDLAQDLLAHLAESGSFKDPKNLNRIVYFDPSRSDYFLPFNVLRNSSSPYVTASNVLEAFRRTWPESLREAPRFTNILLAGLLTLIANKLTLVQLPFLLSDKDFRETCLIRVEDPEIASVFHDRVDKWGRERMWMLESVLNKVSAFTLNPTLRRLLGHPDNRLDFRRILDEGKVLIADLGRCDSETRRLVGSLLVTGMEQAALSRKDEPTRQRRPFYFYVDEFQDFVANEGSAQTLSQILSEARKFGLHLTLAHQVLGQLTSARIQAALGNIGTKIVFAVDRGDAEIMVKKLYQVSTEEIKHQVEDPLQQEKTHPVFYSLPEEWEALTQQIQNLKPRTALVKAPQRGVTKIHTLPVAPHQLSGEDLESLRVELLRRSSGAVPFEESVEKPETEEAITDYEVVESPRRQRVRPGDVPSSEEDGGKPEFL